ncbi:hypothetical protein [Streptomyces sp. ISL-94]|uniref:hypothetical protein n=1 Tax=Streptomyces sp. ISL-94 TaxID=2819190 RepID=UPI001BE957E0|nr:hypothetical protein [Streptomyces sp. ISL-94]MBT2481492.1 hypothetical protein [Streptomyces sp. ISL-94]
MSAGTTAAREAGRRVEEVLDGLAAAGDRQAREAAEELVRTLMDFYGAGLARVVERIGGLPPGADPLARLLDDELVSSLLVLHDLHPEDVHTRIARALDAAAQPVELVGFEEAAGTLRLRSTATGGGCGCGSTGDAVRQRIEDTVGAFAPEVTSVDLAAADPQPTLLQIGTRPQTPARAS